MNAFFQKGFLSGLKKIFFCRPYFWVLLCFLLVIGIYFRPVQFTEKVGDYPNNLSKIESVFGKVENSTGGYSGKDVCLFSYQTNDPLVYKELFDLLNGYSYHRKLFPIRLPNEVESIFVQISSSGAPPLPSLYRMILYETGEVTIGSTSYTVGPFGSGGTTLYQQMRSYLEQHFG